jgi:c-di-GMP-binding flagellar brake protein YcgR
MGSPHRPETDALLLERHRVGDPGERGRLLARLRAGADRVTLYAVGDHDCRVASTVLDVDDRAISLEFVTDDRRGTFERAGGAIAMARLERVTLQFELERIVVDTHRDAPRLRAPVPARLSRLQRREAFRIEPPAESTARLWLQAPRDADVERAVAVSDVSATGLALWLPSDDATLAVIGTVLGRCRLELPGTPPIRCELVVRAIGRALADGLGGLRVGCEFAGLDPSSARAIQVFVNDSQTRARRLRPGGGAG